MMLRKQQKRKDGVGPQSEALSNVINKRPTTAVSLVRYFGNISAAETARVISIDENGVDIMYTQNGMLGKEYEIRVLFERRPVPNGDAAIAEVSRMATEAQSILGVPVNKDYVSPGVRQKPDFSLPKASVLVPVSLAWAVLFALRLSNPISYIPPSLLPTYNFLGGDETISRLLNALLIMHGVEAALTMIFCVVCGVPLWATACWIVTVTVYGIPSLQDAMRVACRHGVYRFPEFFGVPKGVLKEKPGTKKKAASTAEDDQSKKSQ